MNSEKQTALKETEIGLIPQKWNILDFKDVCTLQRGFDLPANNRQPGAYPLVAANGISDYVSEYKVAGPGVTTGRSGTLGKCFYIRENFWPLNTSLWVKDFKGNDAYFIYLLISSLDFSNFNAGSGVPTLNRNHLDLIRISLPPKTQQKKIAEIISSFDEKIELNRQINANLEKLASALFKHWFVDFEFPDKNGKPYKSSGGKMVDSDLGQIPEEWEKKPLDKVANFLRELYTKLP